MSSICLVNKYENKVVRIKTFGGLSVQVNGRCARVHDWKSKKVYQLLLNLIALGGKNISVDVIADMAWPDSEGDKAMQNFEYSLRRLRKKLHDLAGDNASDVKLIILHEGKLSFNADHCRLDIWDWEKYCQQAMDARRHGKLAEAFRSEQLAADLIQGEFMAGEGDIVFSQKEIWRRVCIHWISHTALLWMERAYTAHVNVMPLLDKGMKLDPCSERICMQSMNALLNEGFSIDAMKIFHAWAKLIKHEFDIEPSTRISAFYKSVVG